jgi:putative spermidine/putrescine transport system permease protein
LSLSWLGAIPFLGYVAIFLMLPTLIIAWSAFVSPGGATFSNFAKLTRSDIVSAFVNSLVVSAVTAVIGAVLGALLSYAVVTGNPDGIFRRLVSAACGVLAQFGGVTLTFAFLAAIGPASYTYTFLQQHGINIYGSGYWIYALRGLALVYLYFQIPLMVLVFLPALDGIRPQWREATESLGGGTWQYWRYVAGPLLFPAFLGATLLLFANAFSAYATAAALINQGGIIVPLQIANALTSEVGLHDIGFAAAQALGMILIVTAVTALYSILQRRTSRWLQ